MWLYPPECRDHVPAQWHVCSGTRAGNSRVAHQARVAGPIGARRLGDGFTTVRDLGTPVLDGDAAPRGAINIGHVPGPWHQDLSKLDKTKQWY
jgi:hypothetical protein